MCTRKCWSEMIRSWDDACGFGCGRPWCLPWTRGGVLIGDDAVDAAVNETDTSPRAMLAMIADAAVLMLEGRLRSPDDRGAIRAPIPRAASAVLNRLWSVERPYANPDEIRTALRGLAQKPAFVAAPRSFVQVVILFLRAALPLSCIWLVVLLPAIVKLSAFQARDRSRRDF